MIRNFIFLTLLIVPSFGFAQVYECNVNGQTVFQSKPCIGVMVGEVKPALHQNIKMISDLSKIHLETYDLNFSECKKHVLSMQSSAVQQSFKTIVLENNATNYEVKVCMPPNSAVLITCDGMKRKMFLRRRAPCS